MASGRRDGRAMRSAVVASGIILAGALSFGSWQVSSSTEGLSEALGVRPANAAETPAKAADKGTASTGEKSVDISVATLSKITKYEDARWHPIHFKPLIDTATNEQCLTCHQEVLTSKVRQQSPAGVKAADSIAWYQTLDTYAGDQETFHSRHLTSAFAKEVMNLSCSFCHQGTDPREEAPASSATTPNTGYTLRKMVNPTTTCLLCHGKMPMEVMGLEGKWSDLREGMESPEAPNGCLTCHAEQFRTVRHQVTYLKADAIEASAKKNADTCYGCHGGRAWYMNSHPYPRHAWPGMDPAVPDWAKDRPTESDPRYAVKK